MSVRRRLDDWYDTWQQAMAEDLPQKDSAIACWTRDGEKFTRGRLLRLLRSDPGQWNKFRKKLPDLVWYSVKGQMFWVPGFVMRLHDADLRRCDLSGLFLAGVDFSGSRFTKAKLRSASFKDIPGKPVQRCTIADHCTFRSVDFGRAVLDGAQFNDCDFSHAEFNGASISHASLQNCTFYRTLMCTHFSSAKLQNSDFTEAHMLLTEFEDTDLSECRSLGAAHYHSAIKVDTQTLCKSQNLPPDFFRAAGISPSVERLFRLQSANGRCVRCFISYASGDESKVTWLRRELEQEGIETWFAPRDLPVGARIRDGLETGWADCDALIVVLSASSI